MLIGTKTGHNTFLFTATKDKRPPAAPVLSTPPAPPPGQPPGPVVQHPTGEAPNPAPQPTTEGEAPPPASGIVLG